MLKFGSIFRPGGEQTSLCPSTWVCFTLSCSSSAAHKRAYASTCFFGHGDTPSCSASMPIACELSYEDDFTVPACQATPAANTYTVPSRPRPNCASGPDRPGLPYRTVLYDG